jgi:hypothetical protein
MLRIWKPGIQDKELKLGKQESDALIVFLVSWLPDYSTLQGAGEDTRLYTLNQASDPCNPRNLSRRS